MQKGAAKGLLLGIFILLGITVVTALGSLPALHCGFDDERVVAYEPCSFFQVLGGEKPLR
jgi:hypothetical protein